MASRFACVLVVALLAGCGGGISGGEETAERPSEPTRSAPERSADGRWVEVRVDAIRVAAEPSEGAPAADCESDGVPVEGRATCIAFHVYGNEYNPDGVANTHVFVCALDDSPPREVPAHGRGGRLDVGMLARGAHTFRCEVQAPGGRPVDSNVENNALTGSFEVYSPDTHHLDLALVRPAAVVTSHHAGHTPLGDDGPPPYSTEPYDSFDIELRGEGPATRRRVSVICTTEDHPYAGSWVPDHPREGTYAGWAPEVAAGSTSLHLVGPALDEGEVLALACEIRVLVPDYLPDPHPENDRIAISVTGGPSSADGAATAH